MRKILLLIDENHLDTNVKKPTDYKRIIDKWETQGGGNSGNKLFVTAVSKYLCREGTIVRTFNPQMNEDEINSYDMVVLPAANIFNTNYVMGLKSYTTFFKKVKIPIFVIGAGIQCTNQKELNNLTKTIGKETKEFVEEIYRTGGEIELRGYYTKEFLDKVIDNSAVVAGCPSMYQNGSSIMINISPCSYERFRVAINGSVKSINQTGLYRFLDKQIYMDQDEYIHALYDSREPEASIIRLLWKYSKPGIDAILGNRVKLIYDVRTWVDYLRENVDFSIGTRIHGNIISILCGIPSFVVTCDLRTKELSEFYKIPNSDKFNCKNLKELYEFYHKIDYSDFNNQYRINYAIFEKFMKENGITDSIDTSQEWFDMENKYTWQMPDTVISNSNRDMIEKKYKSTPHIVKKIFEGKKFYAMKKLRRPYKITYTNVGEG